MRQSEREELRRRVQDLHRDHPDWPARRIEGELGSRAPVAYGNWVDETGNADSRLRQIQRWRGGGPMAGPLTGGAFPFIWPVGERQRQELDPAFQPSKVPRAGSSRIFLYNCGPEVVRDLKITLDKVAVGYAPALLVGRFCEIPWMKLAALREAAMAGETARISEHALHVDCVVGRGMKEARLTGTLAFDPTQGWREFRAGQARSAEIE